MRYLIFILVVISSKCFAVPIEKAFSNYFENNFDLAMHEFLELAELGNKQAQYQLGVMYARGEGVDKDIIEAYAWIKSSITGDGAVEEAIEIESKVKSKLSNEQMRQSLLKFNDIQKKYGDKAVEIRTIPRLGTNPSSSFTKALIVRSPHLIFPKRAKSRADNITIEYTIGMDGRVKYPFVMYAIGDEFNRAALNNIKGSVYIPAQIGNQPVESYSMKRRFVFETVGDRIRQGQVNSILKKLREKADRRGSLDMYRYAAYIEILERYLSDDLKQNLDNPNKWFHSSAVNGFSPAKYQLGNNLLYGEQCHSDFDKSYFWLNSAAQDGLVEAQMMLGLERLNGVRFDDDTKTGIAWLRKSAEKYDPAKIELVKALLLKSDNPNLSKLEIMLDEIDYRSFEDKISLIEAKLMIASLQENEKNKNRALKQLKKEAKKLKLPYEQLVANIDRILNGLAPVPLEV